MKRRVAVQWKSGPVAGAIEVTHGRLTHCGGRNGCGEFSFAGKGPFRIELTVDTPNAGPGPESARVTVRSRRDPFSFFLRDVTRRFPLLVPAYGVVVTEADDPRSYVEIEQAVRGLGLQTKLQQIEQAPEESYDQAAQATRNLSCPTWLGVSRDIRLFEIGFEEAGERWCFIQPRLHGHLAKLTETAPEAYRHVFFPGRGIGPVRDITRRLEDGVLPILHTRIVDEGVTYHCTTFATLERRPLTARTLRGTHFLVADGFGHGCMFTPEQQKAREALLPKEMNSPEEVVLWGRVEAVNTTPAPRHAWYKAPAILTGRHWPPDLPPFAFDPKTGFASFAGERVHCISRLNGKPLPQEEMAVLLQPGERCTFEFCIPHQRIPLDRAAKLARQSFDRRHAECRAFWQAKLAKAARLRLPEPRIDEMVRAGLLHLDMITQGREPNGTLAAAIGVYCPIGSESSPIIQFFDSMGRHDLTRRALMYFMDKQHEDGFIQNFGNYMLETGPALWSIGEHWRLTRDDAWVRSIQAKLVKSCDYMIAWRRRNMKGELRGRGYGLMDGKVADPVDPYHIFMLNGYGYLGLSRVAEMLAKIAPPESRRLAKEAEAFKADIRKAFFEGMAASPIVPLGDGAWCPTAAPWTEAVGPVCLFAEKGHWFTHGSFMGRDSMLGPLYLILQEVLDPAEPAADAMVNYSAELYHQRNAALSQPYYSPHLYAHIRRGEVKPYLKGYYNTFSGLADRQTYTFWEHFYHVSPHKTHEEAWFLMQTRWMLWLEAGDTLHLLPAAPRRWLEHGRRIALENVASYFGPVTLRVESRLQSEGAIDATVECRSKRRPRCVSIRLPHPDGQKAVAVTGGSYDAERECIVISPFRGRATVRAQF